MARTRTRPVESVDQECVACDLCGADETTELFSSVDILLKVDDIAHMLVRCSKCGLIYLNPRPAGLALAKYYPDSYEPFSSTGSLSGKIVRAVERLNAAKIASRLAPGARVVEIGCGAGTLLSLLAERGLKVTGVEYSPFAVKEARAAGLDVFQGDLFEAQLPSNAFDTVILKHVIEHLPSPSRALSEIHRILKPGGFVILWLPNVDSIEARLFGRHWHGYDIPRHLYDFSTDTICSMLEQDGLKVASVAYSKVPNDLIRSTRHWMNARFGWSVPWFSTRNVFLLALFTPLSAVFGLLKRSCRITIIAYKKG